MKAKETLQSIYKYNRYTGTFIIPIAIRNQTDLFTHLDPSPIPYRDLAADLVDYLEQCSKEIPLPHPVALEIHTESSNSMADWKKACIESMKNFYQSELLITRADIRRKQLEVVKYLVIAAVSLLLYLVLENFHFESLFSRLLHEAILVGGWVFMWEAVSLSFIGMDDNIMKIKRLKRLIHADIKFLFD